MPDEGSAVTAAGLICRHVPGVPAPAQTHSPPIGSRQNSADTGVPLVGGPTTVVGLPFWQVATRLAISSAKMVKLSAVNSRNRAALLTSFKRLGGDGAHVLQTVIASESRLR